MAEGKKYKIILFDLDGTLVDSGEGIMKCAQHALKAFGINVEDLQALRPFVGPPLEDSFMDFYGFSEDDANKAIEIYRKRYFEKGVFEQHLYDGVVEFMAEVKRRGYVTALATSKMQYQAEYVSYKLFPELGEYIDHAFARDAEGLLHTKADVIDNALKKMGVTDRTEVLMVGDRKFDIEGAKQCGLDSMGVLFGYGDREEMEIAGADYICSDFDEILSVL